MKVTRWSLRDRPAQSLNVLRGHCQKLGQSSLGIDARRTQEYGKKLTTSWHETCLELRQLGNVVRIDTFISVHVKECTNAGQELDDEGRDHRQCQ